MKLIRMIALDCIRYNRKIFVLHVASEKNVLANALSRQNFQKFWKFAPENMRKNLDPIPQDIWPAIQLWRNDEL